MIREIRAVEMLGKAIATAAANAAKRLEELKQVREAEG
ncbi:hypothetical protein [Alphaspiravirus yamagawaense]|uniref:Uncharacterized protein n=1 Tax=Alphaspiravirus yamagawaense TaxID=1157339 RepID=J7QDG2_9VIRU|nr:hypothetical protein [Aeropyrum coil-shaped virus]CCG27841.1 hypothetical protein [Aeropyrum coil-shaped virus]